MTLATWLATQSDRCAHGFHTVQHPELCRCSENADEWTTFLAALRKATRADGTVHQADVRPLIRGRIAPKHIGQCWRRARREGLIREVDYERSDDTAGRNSHRLEPIYRIGAAA